MTAATRITRRIMANDTKTKGKTMNSRLLKSALIAACALAPLAAAPAGPALAQSVATPAQDIVLSIGRGQLVTVPGNMADIFVANDAIADVQVKSQRQLYVFGKSGGETTLYASNASGDIIWSANIRVGSNLDSIPQLLALAMPEADIQVATMGANTVLLTGIVAAPEDAAEAERLVSAFLGEGANVVTRLRMATPLQVNLRVRFAEVSRSLVRTLGANLTTIDGSSGMRFGIGNGRVVAPGEWSPQGPLGVGPGTSAAALAAVRGQRYALIEDRYREITAPVLLLWGREDKVTPLVVGERLVSELPDARLQVYARCGHFPMIEAYAASTRALADFLAEDRQDLADATPAKPPITAPDASGVTP